MTTGDYQRFAGTEYSWAMGLSFADRLSSAPGPRDDLSLPAERIVVTPACSVSLADWAIRKVNSPSVSLASSASILPGSINPRWTCIFIRPGINQVPVTSTTSIPAATEISSAGPMAAILSPSTSTTASRSGAPPFRSTTVPPISAIFPEDSTACTGTQKQRQKQHEHPFLNRHHEITSTGAKPLSRME